MLSRLSSSTSKFFGLQVQIDARSTGISISDDDAIVVDVDYLREFLAPLPNHAWRNVVGSVSPMYKSVQSTISQDSDEVIGLLLRLELEDERRRCEERGLRERPVVPTRENSLQSCQPCSIPVTQQNAHRSSRRRRRSSPTTASTDLKYPNADSSLPIIIITPCPPSTRAEASSSHTPYQHSAYRTRLVVPGYFLANDIHPPQLPQPLSYMTRDSCFSSSSSFSSPSSSAPTSPRSSSSSSSCSWKYAYLGASTMSVKEWKWENGHWNAVLPSLDEQAERGLAARSLTIRKRRSSSPPSCRWHRHKKAS